MLDTYPTAQTFKKRGYDPSSIPKWSHHVQDLVSRIESAFGDISRPAITPHVAHAYDDNLTLSMERGLELTAKDKELHWKDVTDFTIETFYAYFIYADDAGWQFYLPAYMLHSLRKLPSTHDSPVYEASKSLACVRLLTHEQLSCLVDFRKLCEACRTEEGLSYY